MIAKIVWTKALAEQIEVDTSEPYSVLCSNPVECEKDRMVEVGNSWNLWDFICESRNPSTPRKPIRIKGYTNGIMRAWQAGIPKSHPTPRAEDEAGTILFVISKP